MHNDTFTGAPAVLPPASGLSNPVSERPKLVTKTNDSGGIEGGISNGTHMYFTVRFKPPATVGWAKNTATYDKEDGVLKVKGRHDPYVMPRTVPPKRQWQPWPSRKNSRHTKAD